jgi:hypothetical protein
MAGGVASRIASSRGGGVGYAQPTRLTADTVATIEPLGEQATYNLTMAAPYHNYVLASGLVSANSHAVCYAYVAYQTAYLKANYPAEYMAAVLSSQGDDSDKVTIAVGDCRRLGIPVLPPDVQRSQKHFTVEVVEDARAAPAAGAVPGEARRGIRFGLGAVKNVGEGAVDAILAERAKSGPYRSLEEFCRRVDLKAVNKRVLESLIKAGAFDTLGRRRSVSASGWPGRRRRSACSSLTTRSRRQPAGCGSARPPPRRASARRARATKWCSRACSPACAASSRSGRTRCWSPSSKTSTGRSSSSSSRARWSARARSGATTPS